MTNVGLCRPFEALGASDTLKGLQDSSPWASALPADRPAYRSPPGVDTALDGWGSHWARSPKEATPTWAGKGVLGTLLC